MRARRVHTASWQQNHTRHAGLPLICVHHSAIVFGLMISHIMRTSRVGCTVLLVHYLAETTVRCANRETCACLCLSTEQDDDSDDSSDDQPPDRPPPPPTTAE